MTAALAARLHGPHSGEDTAAVAELAVTAARYLAYAVGPHAADGLPGPDTAYEVTGSLDAAALVLADVTTQLAAHLARETTAGHLADDQHRDPAGVTARARSYLDAATRHAAALSAALDRAREDLSHLYPAAASGSTAPARHAPETGCGTAIRATGNATVITGRVQYFTGGPGGWRPSPAPGISRDSRAPTPDQTGGHHD
jgi:hypothetical protein